MKTDLENQNGVRLIDLRRIAEHYAEAEETRAEAQRLIRLAINEAEALAVQSGVPELIFPVLAEEKVTAFRKWDARQQLLRKEQWSLAV